MLEGELAKLAKLAKRMTTISASSTATTTTLNAAQSSETNMMAVPADSIHNDTKSEISVDTSQKQAPLQQHRPVDITDEPSVYTWFIEVLYDNLHTQLS